MWQTFHRDELVARNFYSGDKQCHRDREDAVAERFDPRRLSFFVHMRDDSSPLYSRSSEPLLILRESAIGSVDGRALRDLGKLPIVRLEASGGAE